MELDKLYISLGYTFRQPELLTQSLRHSSFVNEQQDSDLEDNERLEFLGDAVLDLAISHILMDLFENAEEGKLSKFRAMMVDVTGLTQIAKDLDLGTFLLLGKGEDQSNGREKPSILANSMEAVIGALYLDAGFSTALLIIRKLFSPLLEKLDGRDLVTDYKSILQEYTQKKLKVLPSYQMIEEIGPPHDRTFKVALILNDEKIAEAEGKNKKEAEQKVAKETYFCLKKKDPVL